MIAIKLTKHDLQDAHSDIETNDIPSVYHFRIPSSLLLMADAVYWENKSGRTTVRANLTRPKVVPKGDNVVLLDSSLCVISKDSFLSPRDAKLVHNMIGELMLHSFTLMSDELHCAHPNDIAYQYAFYQSFADELPDEE